MTPALSLCMIYKDVASEREEETTTTTNVTSMCVLCAKKTYNRPCKTCSLIFFFVIEAIKDFQGLF